MELRIFGDYEYDDQLGESGPTMQKHEEPLPTTVVALLVYLVRKGVKIDPEVEKVFDSVSNAYTNTLRHKDKVITDLSKKLETSINVDPVTNLPLRVISEHEFAMCVQEEKRRAGFTIMFVDCHSFKWYNDNLGHDVGDKVLRTIAEILRYQIRKYDFAGKWGGDEILALMYDLNSLDEALDAAVRFVKAVRDYAWSTVDCGLEQRPPKVDVGMIYCPISSSVDRQMIRDNANEIQKSLIVRVDELMYEAKAQHREGRPSIGVEIAEFPRGEVKFKEASVGRIVAVE